MSREIEDGSGWEGMVPQRAEPSYETMFRQEREAYERLEYELKNVRADYEDLLRRIAAARSLLAPLGGQAFPSVLAIREALNILR